ncbi:hypothetical protein GQ600_7805 [Phytophthora cactorum]|nr:hypothetical protein GQ600_7805 [Phytophthora cactorum]
MSVFLTVDTTVAVCDAFNAVQEGEAKEGSTATTLTDRPRSEKNHEARLNDAAPIKDTPRHFHPLSKEEQAQCMELLRRELGADGLDECACAICDRLVLRRDVVRNDGYDWKYMDILREILGEAGSDVPRLLREQYRASPLVAGLENVMVSPRGIQCYVDESGFPGAWLSVCRDCSASIRRLKLPKFAIANGFFMGALPDNLKGLTIPNG